MIVPTFNRAVLLRDCLDSLLAQTVRPKRIVVVDDGSTDDTALVVSSYEGLISYRRHENRGKASSLNAALADVEDGFVWIFDDDDIALPNALETLQGLLVQNPSAEIAYGRHLRFTQNDGDGRRVLTDTGYWRKCAGQDFFTATMEDFFAHQPGMLVSRSLYRKVGEFDVDLMRSLDYQMLIRLARAGASVEAREPVFLQRQHDGPRGQLGARFASAERDSKWLHYDQKIFRRLVEEIPIGEYAADTDRPLFKATLQRAVILARKKLWDLAVADFIQAATLFDGDLDQQTRDMIRRSFGSKYGVDELSDPSVRSGILAIQAVGPGGVAIAGQLSIGLRWRVREAFEGGRLATALSLGLLSIRLGARRHVRAARVERTSEVAAEPVLGEPVLGEPGLGLPI